jgi:hypothetical protein
MTESVLLAGRTLTSAAVIIPVTVPDAGHAGFGPPHRKTIIPPLVSLRSEPVDLGLESSTARREHRGNLIEGTEVRFEEVSAIQVLRVRAECKKDKCE